MPATKKAKSRVIRPQKRPIELPPVVNPPQPPTNDGGNQSTNTDKSNNSVPSSFGCSFYRETLLPSPISPMGSGWSGRCNIGDYYSNGNILPTFGLGGSTLNSLGKLLPSSNPNMPGTYVESSSLTGYLGLDDVQLSPIHKDIMGGKVRIGDVSKRSSTLIGIGKFSATDSINWNTFSIRQEIERGLAFSAFSPNFFMHPSIGVGIESVLNFNKPENAPTLRDNARLMSVNVGLEFEYRALERRLNDREAYPEDFQTWALVNYIYSDVMSGATAFINYQSIDKDIAKTKTFIENNIGAQDNSQEPSATSDTPTLLSFAHFFGAISIGTTRQQYIRMDNDWQNRLLVYHLGRTLLVGGLAAATDRPDVLAPTTFSSVRNLFDLFALRHSKSPKEALAYHLLIGGGMMALGAAANGSLYGKALSQAGMEGFTATALSPDSFYDSNWVKATMYEYQPLSLYTRSGTKVNARGSRPALRIETTFNDSALYVASELATPMADIRSIGGRAAALVSNNEGTMDYANSDVPIPSVVVSTVGLQASSYSKGNVVSVNSNIGVGPQLEWSENSLEPGIGGEVGAGIAFHPSESWSLGLSGRCSATKFITGYSTECNAGFNLQFLKK